MRYRSRLVAPVLLAAGLLVSGCLPAAPSPGRAAPVRRVLVVGDSITWGFFGVTPGVNDTLAAKLRRNGIGLTTLGFPGDSIAAPWPGRPRWAELLPPAIDSVDPDVVVIQSLLFPGWADPAVHEAYLANARELITIARSRGAHVYLVRHQRGAGAQAAETATAEALQAQAAAGLGVEVIPTNWWLDRCEDPYIPDGFHLTASGIECYANSINAAVNQLRNQVG